jgi:hypothetical protein
MRVRYLAFALALTLAFSAGAANADVVVTFNDLTETPSVSVTGGPAITGQVGPENFVVILPSGTLSAPPTTAINAVFGLTEPGTTGFSDLIYFASIPGTTGLLINFQSDEEGGPPLVVAPGFTLFGSIPETGAVQGIPLPPGVSAPGLTVFVQSGLEAIPEPSILAMAGTGGLLGLGLWGYRRRKA